MLIGDHPIIILKLTTYLYEFLADELLSSMKSKTEGGEAARLNRYIDSNESNLLNR
jgi:hypothetical protein